jgi:hypothetical protein
LSGADFDGDAAVVIPIKSNRLSIKSDANSEIPALKSLKEFNPKSYALPDSAPRVSNSTKQREMGEVTNLITDMTLKGAKDHEIARAVRHSMVVIDAEKHELDYKQSETDNKIAELKRRYQGTIDPVTGRYHEGASTLISKAKSKEVVQKRTGTPKVNEKGRDWYDPSRPEGVIVWPNSKPEFYISKTGKTKMRTQDSTKMAEADNPRTLSSGTPQEEAYVKYAQEMKDLANKARLESIHTQEMKYSSSANKTYRQEYDHLNHQLNIALKNAPRERQAQAMANVIVRKKIESDPDLKSKEKKKELKKIKQQALTSSRAKVGAKRSTIDISEREWEAIQSGAISATQLKQILRFADIDKVREFATPRSRKEITPAKQAKIASLKASGYTNREIADMMSISMSTVSKYL